jgi:hypothetical protein
MTITATDPDDTGSEAEHRPPVRLLPWILLEWWFLGLLGYELLQSQREHAVGVVPYLLVLGAVIAVYALLRRHRRADDRR